MLKILKHARAENDLIEIWIYSHERWGEVQAERYFDELEKGIKQLGRNPRTRPAVRSDPGRIPLAPDQPPHRLLHRDAACYSHHPRAARTDGPRPEFLSTLSSCSQLSHDVLMFFSFIGPAPSRRRPRLVAFNLDLILAGLGLPKIEGRLHSDPALRCEPNAFDSRIAISGKTPALPLIRRDSAARLTPSTLAVSVTDSPSGSRQSTRTDRPG